MASNAKFDEEEMKSHERESTMLPPLTKPATPPLAEMRPVSGKKPPSIMPRKALQRNSNKKLIRNALQLVVLAGQTE